MSLRSDYDLWHRKKQNLDPAHDDASSPWYAWVRESLTDIKGLRILEAACSRGNFVSSLVRADAIAYGLDFSFAAVQVAEGKTSHESCASPICLVQGDAHALPFPGGYFDVVVSCETIEHLPFPSRRFANSIGSPGPAESSF